MTKLFYREFKLGILGGGQLGRMLVQSAIDFNLLTYVLDPFADAPAAQNCTTFVQGDFRDYSTVYQFGQELDLLTIEIEDVNFNALLQLQSEGLQVFPQPQVLQVVQDKGLQKLFYRHNNFPTADFHLIETKEDLTEISYFFPAVVKNRKSGYDGKGVWICNTAEEAKAILSAPCVVERKISIAKEISAIVARSEQGQMSVFPLVEMVFDPVANLVDYLFAPAAVTPEQQKHIHEIALALAEKLEIVGLLAVEFMIDQGGAVWVNEVAPRPHNSGHHTIEANYTSQFEQHLRAILGLPLGLTASKLASVMVNLLGHPGYKGKPLYTGIESVLALPGVSVHLYGKPLTSPYRKMGHATVVNSDLAEALKIVNLIKEKLKIIAEYD